MADTKAMYQRAFREFAAQNYEGAIGGYLEVIEADGQFVLAYQALAEAYGRNGQLEEAVGAIKKAIEIEPDEPLFHTSLSRFYQQQGRVPEAEEAAEAATRLQSKGSIL